MKKWHGLRSTLKERRILIEVESVLYAAMNSSYAVGLEAS